MFWNSLFLNHIFLTKHIFETASLIDAFDKKYWTVICRTSVKIFDCNFVIADFSKGAFFYYVTQLGERVSQEPLHTYFFLICMDILLRGAKNQFLCYVIKKRSLIVVLDYGNQTNSHFFAFDSLQNVCKLTFLKTNVGEHTTKAKWQTEFVCLFAVV